MSNSGAEAMLRQVLVTLLSEALYGPRGDAFFLNSGDRGLVASLDALSAETASARPGGRSSVASHVEHLRYGLELLNREAKGESLWAIANWADAWTHQTVTEDQWREAQSRSRPRGAGVARSHEASACMGRRRPRFCGRQHPASGLSPWRHPATRAGGERTACHELITGVSIADAEALG